MKDKHIVLLVGRSDDRMIKQKGDQPWRSLCHQREAVTSSLSL